MQRTDSRYLMLCVAHILGAVCSPAHASEGGASFYLLGSGGPEAAVMPPVTGLYFDDTLYIYDGSAEADRQFVVGGNVVAGIDATIVGVFPSCSGCPQRNSSAEPWGLEFRFPMVRPLSM